MTVMNDIQQARRALDDGTYTCVLIKGKDMYTSEKKGIAPLLHFIEQGTDLRGCAAADIVVGKAAALLFVLMGVTAVSTPVMSLDAKRVLQEAGIPWTADELVPHIISRDGRGVCPMEQAVADTEDPAQGLLLLKAAATRLRGQTTAGGKLGFGMMRLPLTEEEQVDLPQVCRMVDEFLAGGFTYFDTAYMYHDGKSEEILRQALVCRHPRDSFTVADKMPVMMLKEAADVPRIFQEQLQRCGVDYFDYYLLHCLTAEHVKTAERLGVFEFLQEKKQEGKIRSLGFSFHDTAAVLEDILTNHPQMDFVQLQVNYLDWDSPSVQSRDCCLVARKHDKPVVIMEPVRGGALAKLPEAALSLLRQEDPSLSPAAWAIRFAATLPGVTMVLSGMSNMAQLQDNMKTAAAPAMTNRQRALLFQVAEIVRSTPAIPCTACDYCRAVCPAGINISALFATCNGRSRASLCGQDQQPFRESYQKICDEGASPTACLACHACEGACPQHLPIVKELANIAKLFS